MGGQDYRQDVWMPSRNWISNFWNFETSGAGNASRNLPTIFAWDTYARSDMKACYSCCKAEFKKHIHNSVKKKLRTTLSQGPIRILCLKDSTIFYNIYIDLVWWVLMDSFAPEHHWLLSEKQSSWFCTHSRKMKFSMAISFYEGYIQEDGPQVIRIHAQ